MEERKRDWECDNVASEIEKGVGIKVAIEGRKQCRKLYWASKVAE